MTARPHITESLGTPSTIWHLYAHSSLYSTDYAWHTQCSALCETRCEHFGVLDSVRDCDNVVCS